MLRLGSQIRLTGPEREKLERLTGRKTPPIRSMQELRDHIRACAAAHRDSNPTKARLRLAVLQHYCCKALGV
jgi:hypothetical protein